MEIEGKNPSVIQNRTRPGHRDRTGMPLEPLLDGVSDDEARPFGAAVLLDYRQSDRARKKGSSGNVSLI